jgi:hypothetical protein
MKQDDTSKKSGTNWERLRTMKDEDIDFSEIPECTPEMFARAIVRRGLKPPPAAIKPESMPCCELIWKPINRKPPTADNP